MTLDDSVQAAVEATLSCPRRQYLEQRPLPGFTSSWTLVLSCPCRDHVTVGLLLSQSRGTVSGNASGSARRKKRSSRSMNGQA